MTITTVELALAKDAAAALLEQLRLEAYLFEVEPNEGTWELRIDCAMEGGWQSSKLPVDKERLLASRSDGATRRALLSDWRQSLSVCKKEANRKI